MKDIQGWMTDDELNWLHDTARKMKSIVEIGSWKGRSTQALLEGCPHGVVFAVDHFKGSPDELDSYHKEAREGVDIYKEFYANVGHYKNLVTMRMASVDAAKFFRTCSIDMAFIDGCHTREAVTEDIKAWIPVGKMICGHDRRLVGGFIEDLLWYGPTPMKLTAGPGDIWIIEDK